MCVHTYPEVRIDGLNSLANTCLLTGVEEARKAIRMRHKKGRRKRSYTKK